MSGINPRKNLNHLIFPIFLTMPEHETLRIRTPPAKDEDEGSRIPKENIRVISEGEIINKTICCINKIYDYVSSYLTLKIETNKIHLLS